MSKKQEVQGKPNFLLGIIFAAFWIWHLCEQDGYVTRSITEWIFEFFMIFFWFIAGCSIGAVIKGGKSE